MSFRILLAVLVGTGVVFGLSTAPANDSLPYLRKSASTAVVATAADSGLDDLSSFLPAARIGASRQVSHDALTSEGADFKGCNSHAAAGSSAFFSPVSALDFARADCASAFSAAGSFSIAGDRLPEIHQSITT